MMLIGIDIGGTNTQGVLLEGNELKSAVSVEGNQPKHAAECLSKLRRRAGVSRPGLMLTGGGSRRVGKTALGMPFRMVDEIKAIGRGGMYLSGKRDVFVVSMGTGTAFVSVKSGRARHVGGTGLGGGTVRGLSNLMLGVPLAKLEDTASRSAMSLDLTVGDIVGGGVGRIPPEATASNFGKAVPGSCKRDIASSLLKMVGETIGVTSFFAAKTVGQEKSMLICGRVALNGVIKKDIRGTIRMLGGKADIPRKAAYCAAIGAALS